MKFLHHLSQQRFIFQERSQPEGPKPAPYVPSFDMQGPEAAPFNMASYEAEEAARVPTEAKNAADKTKSYVERHGLTDAFKDWTGVSITERADVVFNAVKDKQTALKTSKSKPVAAIVKNYEKRNPGKVFDDGEFGGTTVRACIAQDVEDRVGDKREAAKHSTDPNDWEVDPMAADSTVYIAGDVARYVDVKGVPTYVNAGRPMVRKPTAEEPSTIIGPRGKGGEIWEVSDVDKPAPKKTATGKVEKFNDKIVAGQKVRVISGGDEMIRQGDVVTVTQITEDGIMVKDKRNVGFMLSKDAVEPINGPGSQTNS